MNRKRTAEARIVSKRAAQNDAGEPAARRCIICIKASLPSQAPLQAASDGRAIAIIYIASRAVFTWARGRFHKKSVPLYRPIVHVGNQRFVARDTAIEEFHQPVATDCQPRIVRYHHKRRAALGVHAPQQYENFI